MSAECSAGKIPLGYKQTEVGVIPEDWESSKIGEYSFVTKLAGFEYTLHFDYSKSGPIIAVRALNIKDGALNLDDVHTIPKETSDALPRSKLKKGDLVISYVGTLGRVAVVPENDKFHLAPNVAKITVSRELVSPAFLSHFLNSFQGQKNIFEAAASTTQAALSMSNLREVFFVRPSLVEQETIAEALSDADALIESIEQLVAKKCQIKQGAMQELLTGKKRLPGFSGEWKTKLLGNTAVLKARIGWQGLTTNEYLDSGDYYLITGTEFKDGYIDWSNCHYVAESRYKQDKNIQLKEHDVLVTKDGTIGKVALINHLHKPATLNSGVFVIRPIENAFYPEFFYYLLCSNIFTEFLVQLSAGSTINHLYQKDFVNFIYRTPATIEEQNTIAAILSDMDSEITTLEEKLAKTRQLKQGMMQELLIGRIRLI